MLPKASCKGVFIVREKHHHVRGTGCQGDMLAGRLPSPGSHRGPSHHQGTLATRQRLACKPARSSCLCQLGHDVSIPHHNVLLVVGALKLQTSGEGGQGKELLAAAALLPGTC